ncbi:uncharacterized protein LOC115008850 [Cottoperca gobio]|uniref:Uncharacterized protein LOC115008850 n=1 Tax=Cottoperca gobio TaxID=56716 RepID=A0A6J2PQX0_COTGO|nr:uncharacterized protein LOC115008850 [Cottoperca gobio]
MDSADIMNDELHNLTYTLIIIFGEWTRNPCWRMRQAVPRLARKEVAKKPEMKSLLPEWLQDFVYTPLCQPNLADPSAPLPSAELRQPPSPFAQPLPPVGPHQTPVPETFLGTRLALGGPRSLQGTSRSWRKRPRPRQTPVSAARPQQHQVPAAGLRQHPVSTAGPQQPPVPHGPRQSPVSADGPRQPPVPIAGSLQTSAPAAAGPLFPRGSWETAGASRPQLYPSCPSRPQPLCSLAGVILVCVFQFYLLLCIFASFYKIKLSFCYNLVQCTAFGSSSFPHHDIFRNFLRVSCALQIPGETSHQEKLAGNIFQ